MFYCRVGLGGIRLVQVSRMKNKEEYFTKTQLKERGWTDSIIKKFLPKTDLEKKNPFNRSASIKLYKKEKVRKIEGEQDFQLVFNKSQKRSRAAKATSNLKVEELINETKQIEITIVELTKSKLVKEACESYNNFNAEYKDYLATPESDPLFLNRICVNYLRHNCAVYDETLDGLFRKVGKWNAYVVLKERILEAIANQYSWLKDECERQISNIKKQA